MKHALITFFLLAAMLNTNIAQEASVENSTCGIQVGISPLSIYNELKMTNTLALRTELAFGFSYSLTQWTVMPVLIVEPRYYYNLKKRLEKGKRIDGNSGNRISVLMGYEPGVVLSSNNKKTYPSFNVMPSWGIRRNIGQHFNYEVGLGLGYGWTFSEYPIGDAIVRPNTHGVVYGIRLGIGYQF